MILITVEILITMIINGYSRRMRDSTITTVRKDLNDDDDDDGGNSLVNLIIKHKMSVLNKQINRQEEQSAGNSENNTSVSTSKLVDQN